MPKLSRDLRTQSFRLRENKTHNNQTCAAFRGCRCAPPSPIDTQPFGLINKVVRPWYIRVMASTLTAILLHVTFSTKARAPLIPSNDELDLYSYIGGICRYRECVLMAMDGTADHVHMLVSLSKTMALSDLMLNVKRESSKWMRERVPEFEWQDGYFAFSIGASQVEQVRQYISHQKEHHATIDFKDEVRAFLRKYAIDWDERYIWA